VEDLADDRAAVAVDGLRESAVAGDAGVLGRHQDMRRVARALVDARDLDDDETDAAGRARGLVGDELVRDEAVDRHDRVVTGRHDPVAQRGY
jgi:hypothetical protein